MTTLLALLLAAVPARSATTDVAAPKTGASAQLSVSSSAVSEQTADNLLGGSHGIRDTHRVAIGDRNMGPNGKPGANTPAAAKPGGSSRPTGASGGGKMDMPNDGEIHVNMHASAGPATQNMVVNQMPTGALNVDSGRAMLGGTPKDLRSAAYKADAAVQTADSHMRMGDYKGAIQETMRALVVDSSNTAALALQAECYAKLRDFSSAESALQRAVAVDSADFKTWEQLAYVRLREGRNDEALDAALKAIDAGDSGADILALRARAREALGMRGAAAADIKEAAKLDPRYAGRAALADGTGPIWKDAGEEMATANRGGAAGFGGLPPWAPWVGGPVLIGIGLALVIFRMATPPPPPPEGPPPLEPPQQS